MTNDGTLRAEKPLRGLALAVFAFVLGCGSNEAPPAPDAGGTGGSAPATAGTGADAGGRAGSPEVSGNAGTTSGSPSSGGAGGTGGAGNGGTGGAGSGGAGGTGGAGDGGTGGFQEIGVCGHRGESSVNDGEFEGFEEYFLIGEEGFGEDICIVRFDVTRVGAAPAGCTDCLWSHLVELGNPTTELDENGVCAKSQLAFDAARIGELDGARIAYGFVPEFAGHVSVVMKYDEALAAWDAFGSASYDEDAETLKFERRNGNCRY
jgi:hypothetical protein